MKLVLATNNKHKAEEIKSRLNNVEIYTANDFDNAPDPEENGTTLEENALIKVKAFYEATGIQSLADDTGLFVDALNGEPGIYSARYAGENASYSDNVIKLLQKLQDETNRNAYFKTVMCLYNENGEEYFEGICRGKIIISPRGENGFGYDPVFIPEGYDKTFAEMTNEEKNEISHRSSAVKEFIRYISETKQE